MRAAGLKAIETVMVTSCCLIKSSQPKHPELIQTILSRIRGYISAQKYVLCNYNVAEKDLETVMDITPGRRAPTVQNLITRDGQDWKAVSAMVFKKDIANIMVSRTVLVGVSLIREGSVDECRCS